MTISPKIKPLMGFQPVPVFSCESHTIVKFHMPNYTPFGFALINLENPDVVESYHVDFDSAKNALLKSLRKMMKREALTDNPFI